MKESAASNMGHFWQKLQLSPEQLNSDNAAADSIVTQMEIQSRS